MNCGHLLLDEDALKKRKKLIRRPGNDKTPETPGDIDYSRLASVSAVNITLDVIGLMQLKVSSLKVLSSRPLYFQPLH